MQVRILGPLEVWDDGRVVGLGAGRQRALLALLALHAREIVATDRLIEELWGGSPPPLTAAPAPIRATNVEAMRIWPLV